MQEQPDWWQQGIRYEVFIHVGLVEDYTAAAHDLHGAISNPAAFKPVKRPYVWLYGLVDGAPTDARAKFPARLPLPPREPANRERGPTLGNVIGGARRFDAMMHQSAAGNTMRNDSTTRWARSRHG